MNVLEKFGMIGRSGEPWCICVLTEFYVDIFACFLCSFGPPPCALVAYHRERLMLPLHDAVG